MQLEIPKDFQFRDYQMPAINAFDSGIDRLFLFWHRRAGKDICLFSLMAREAARVKGLYYYFFPTYAQGKKILWEGMTHDGREYLDLIPKEIIASKSTQELKIIFKNGSIIRIIGTDNYDAVRGTNPIGCVFSEFAYQNPMAWEVISPILAANGGWAIFNTTPNGKNHAYRLYERARKLDYWFTEKLTIEQTNAIPIEMIQMERDEGKEEAMIQQEYYCKIGELLGAIYGKEMEELEASGRFCLVPYENTFKVDVFFDLGRNDTTSMGFLQEFGRELRIIDYYQCRLEDISHYIDILMELNYNYGTIWLPHDGFHKRIEAKLSCAEQLEQAGFKVRMVPMSSVANGIRQLRRIFPRIYLNKDHCEALRDALENYKRTYDLNKKTFSDEPLHDWASHPADMMRYLAIVVGTRDADGKNTIEDYQEAHAEYVASSGGLTYRGENDEMQEYRRAHSQFLKSLK